ncbi:MAG: A/G-specific adenine glycosylase, partial [Bacteroidia bacterium]
MSGNANYRAFRRSLLTWYEANKRDLPWRNTKDPYKIWISEIILQQTQVAQGLAYYNRIISEFPDVEALAKAELDAILKHWQGLGYYSRARNLHAAANQIKQEYKGKFPDNYRELLNLKGVGTYTAAAIASFSYKTPVAVVDGNVYRVLSRIFGIETPIDTLSGKKEFQNMADKLLDIHSPDIYNQAIMEFGALYCKGSNPDCENCIFQKNCFALKFDKVKLLPVKEKKVKVKKRVLNYFIIIDKNKNCIIQKREASDIWKGLYEFPLI